MSAGPRSIPTSRVVRVFISSTFRDFGEERDLLMKRVFPELRRRARDRFVEVIGVDLRWGITEEESQQGETLPICLREIERSRPYFIGLLGERYGWTPAAGQYPENLLAQQPWLAEHAGGKSVTELEILHGVLNAPEMAGRAYFYFRDAAWSEGKGADFRSEGADERAKLARLKERVRSSPFPVVDYPTPEAVADRITEDLWRLIDSEYPADAVPDELERERRIHEAYALERRRVYVGQEETVAALLARLEQASDEKGEETARSRITLVTGESGTGKSALIANVLARYRERHPEHVVIEHYIGSTSSASDPVKFMRRIAGEIKTMTESSREIERDREKLGEQFPEWLAEASRWASRKGRAVVIAFDALDKLSGEADLQWLPKSTAPCLRLLVSSLSGESREVLEKRCVERIAAMPFTQVTARAYLLETLARRGRKLPAREIDRIVAHPRSTLPIFLKTLVDELSVFGSYEDLPQRITECLSAEEPDDLFELILARLEVDLGEEKVRKPLAAMCASWDGMSDDELIGFTGVSPLELARLRLSLDDALYESGGLVRLAHAYASKAIDDRYLQTDDACTFRRELGLWWEGREPSERMGFHACCHLYVAGAWADLARCLSHPRTAIGAITAMEAPWHYELWKELADRARKPTAEVLEAIMKIVWSDWEEALRGANRGNVLPALRELFDLLLLAGAQKGAEMVARHRLSVARQRAEESRTLTTLLDVSSCHARLGDLFWRQGDFAASRECFSQSLEICRSLLAGDHSERLLQQVSGSLDRVGDTLAACDDWSAALKHYEESLEIRQRWADEFPGHQSQLWLSTSLHCVGKVLANQKEISRALEYHGRGLAIRRSILAEDETLAALEDVADSLDFIGAALALRSDWAAALMNREEALEIRRRLLEDRRTTDRMRDLGASLLQVGFVLKASGDLSGALKVQEEALVLFRELAEDGETLDRLEFLSKALYEVAFTEGMCGNLDGAMARHSESLAIDRRLLAKGENLGRLRRLSRSLNGLGFILSQRGDASGALELYEESLGIRRRLLADHETPDRLRSLLVSLANTASIYEARKAWSEALDRHEESLGIARRLVRDFGEPIPRWIEDFVDSLEHCRECAIELGDFERAYGYAVERWELDGKGLDGKTHKRFRKDALSHFCCLLRCEIELGMLDEADESATTLQDWVAKLVQLFDKPENIEARELASSTLLCCAEALELVSRLRSCQGNARATRSTLRSSRALRARAEALMSAEDKPDSSDGAQ